MGTPSVSLSLPFLPQKEEVDAFQTTSLGTMHVHRQLKAQTNAKLHSLTQHFFAVLAPLPEVDPFGLAARPKPDRSQMKTTYFGELLPEGKEMDYGPRRAFAPSGCC